MDYYNEIDAYAADWLQRLIAEKVIPDGHVDRRDIRDIRPSDLAGYRRCHFFAGLGGWARALALAGWPEDRPVWTGSCPCQPFSAAGKGLGFADERHLWPAWFWLIVQCRPDILFGEQVDKALAWFDLVATDLEGEGYACGSAVLPAAGSGAPHGRHRLWFVADTERGAAEPRRYEVGAAPRSSEGQAHERQRFRDELRAGSNAGGVANANLALPSDGGLQRSGRLVQLAEDAAAGELGDAHNTRSQGRALLSECAGERLVGSSGMAGDFWSDCDWIYCRDGKCRPVEPGTFPLAHGVPNRVGRLRAYGNAIVPQIAAGFVRAYSDERGID